MGVYVHWPIRSSGTEYNTVYNFRQTIYMPCRNSIDAKFFCVPALQAYEARIAAGKIERDAGGKKAKKARAGAAGGAAGAFGGVSGVSLKGLSEEEQVILQDVSGVDQDTHKPHCDMKTVIDNWNKLTPARREELLPQLVKVIEQIWVKTYKFEKAIIFHHCKGWIS